MLVLVVQLRSRFQTWQKLKSRTGALETFLDLELHGKKQNIGLRHHVGPQRLCTEVELHQ